MSEIYKFTANRKNVEVFACLMPNKPIVYLNNYLDSGKAIFDALENSDFSLAVISGLDWNKDMPPWAIPPITKNDTPCSGGADEYLKILTEEIVPKAEEYIFGKPLWRGLAGLFAVYSAHKTDIFSRLASVSGSLWFPNFKEFLFQNQMKTTPKCMYFSVGEKECKTQNKLLQNVQANTEEIERFYRENGIKTIFELNSGNHFVNAEKRMARGISWIAKYV